MKEATLYIS